MKLPSASALSAQQSSVSALSAQLSSVNALSAQISSVNALSAQLPSGSSLSAQLSSVSALSAQLLFRPNYPPSVQQAYPLIQFRTHIPSTRLAPSDPTNNEAAPQADGRYQVGCGCELYSAESFIRLKDPATLTWQVTVSVHSVTDTDDTGNEFRAHFIPDGAMGGGWREQSGPVY